MTEQTRKPLTSTTAAEIATMIPQIMRDRAEREDPSNWARRSSYLAYVDLLHTGAARVVSPTMVLASVRGPLADIWNGVVAEAIDIATEDYDLPNGHTHYAGPGYYKFDLACTCDMHAVPVE